MNSDYKAIRVAYPEEGIAVMSFIRPEKLNAWSREVLNDLLDFFAGLHTDSQTKVVILRGEGERAFCTGADFESLFPKPGDRDSASISYRLQEQLRELVVLVRHAPQIIISACHGYAVGGGFFLAMASDIRVIADDVKFSAPLLKMGLTCGDLGCSYMLPRLIGDGVARDILLTGRYMYAEEAMRLGFASECVSLEKLDETAMEKARGLAGYTRAALQYSKELLNLMETVNDVDTAIRIENRNQQMTKAFNRDERRKAAQETIESN